MFVGVAHKNTYDAYRKRLDALLCIPADMTAQTIHKIIEFGFTAATVQALYDIGAITSQVRDQIISPSNLKMRLTGSQRLTVAESDRLFRIVHVQALAEVFFGNQEKAKRWLSKPKDQFSGNSPADLLSTTPGTCLVEEMLIRGLEGFTL